MRFRSRRRASPVTQGATEFRCPLLAQSRHQLVHRTCPLSGVKRTTFQYVKDFADQNSRRPFSRLNVFWRCFERRRNADHLRNRQGPRFKLIAHQDQQAKKNRPSDQEVRQNWHSHRSSPSRGSSAWCLKYGSGASSDLCCKSHPRRNSRRGYLVEKMAMSAIGA